jgi:lysozyme
MANKARLALGAVALAAALVASFEGLRTKAYPDPAYGEFIPTICFGHTQGVQMGDEKTPQECSAILQSDVSIAWRRMDSLVTVPLTEGETAAYTSFVFNAGPGKFQSSTMLRKLNSGDHIGACNELPKWKYSNGIEMAGLVRRRAAEQAMCLRDLR